MYTAYLHDIRAGAGGDGADVSGAEHYLFARSVATGAGDRERKGIRV